MARAVALVGFIGLVFTACPRAARLDPGPMGEPRNAEALLKRVLIVESTVMSVVGDAKLSVDTPQGKGATNLYVGVHLPDLLHIEQIDFFNRPQSVLITREGNFGLYDAQNARYTRGPSSPINLSQFLPLVLPPHELAGLMTGRTPRIAHEIASFMPDDKRGVYVLTLRKGNITQTLDIATPSYRIVKSTITGIEAYDVEFSELKNFDGAVLPKRLALTASAAKLWVELTFKDVKVNQPLDLMLYDLDPPSGVQVVDVDEKGAPRLTGADADAGAP